MKASRFLIGSAALALGAGMAWGSPATTSPRALAPAMQNQGGGRQQFSPARRAQQMTNRLDRAVGLTPDQKTKVQAIYEKEATDMAAARQSGADREAMRKINQQTTQDVKALLTPDQLAKFPQPRRGRPGANPPAGAQ